MDLDTYLFIIEKHPAAKEEVRFDPAGINLHYDESLRCFQAHHQQAEQLPEPQVMFNNASLLNKPFV